MVCQGGFPLNTLKNDGAGLSRFLKACLRDHERYPTEPMGEITQRYVGYIPSTLNNSEVRSLVGKVVKAIADFRKLSDDALEEGLTRFEYLEKHHTDWETALPLRVQDPEAKALLLGLLDAARHQPFARQAIFVSTTMRLGGAEGVISRTIKIPTQLSQEDFRKQFGFGVDDKILPRMTGFLQAGETRTACVNISLNHDATKFRLNKFSTTSLFGQQAYQATTLVLAVGGQEVKTVELAGGEALLRQRPLHTERRTREDLFSTTG